MVEALVGTGQIDAVLEKELLDGGREGHKVTMENFELIRVLGKGAYGKVFMVRKVGGSDQGHIYAMKVLRKSRVVTKPKTLQHTLAERSVLEHIRNSPFLVTLHYAFQTDTKLHLVMEYISGGELFTHLCAKGSFSFQATQFYMAELTLALDKLHQIGIIYRDLKLENIMLDNTGHLILTDFGLSKEFAEDDPIEYMAPEIVKRTEEGYTASVDWWSLGVLSFELLTGCSPFTVEGAKNSSREIAERILAKKVPFPKNFNIVCRDFVDKLLSKKANKRLGHTNVQEIKNHPFFKGIEWAKIEKKEIEPPFRPSVTHAFDVKNFAPEFINQPPIYSPADTPNEPNAKQLFRGYSFVAPSVMLSNNNIISSEYLGSVMEELPLDIQKFGEDQDSPFFNKYSLNLNDSGFLGQGAFSVCRICQQKSSGAEFAVKIISQRYAVVANREAKILSMCRDHRNVVKLEEIIEDKFHLYIVLELLKGPELLTRIRKSVNFTEGEAARITRKLASAIRYLHSKGIVHRDLKPENIIFESDDPKADLCLVDFGFARMLPSAGKPLTTPCFTLHYAAPEVLNKNPFTAIEQDWLPQYNQQCDLWSLGVIVYTMLSGHVPFHVENKFESASDIMNRIRSAEFSLKGKEWEGVSDDAKRFIKSLLTVNPVERMTADELANHPWMLVRNTPETPLATPTVLGVSAAREFNATHNAFLTANKEGFHLADVSAAPLAQRRMNRSNDSGYSTAGSTPPTAGGGSEIAEQQSGGRQKSDSGGSSGGKRKRKLNTVQEESLEMELQEGEGAPKAVKTVEQPTSRPTTLILGDPLSPDTESFTRYRVEPISRRVTNPPSVDVPPPAPRANDVSTPEDGSDG